MKNSNYIYNVNYQFGEDELCAMEVKALFKIRLESKIFFSEKEIDPSISPYLKNRIKIMYKATTLDEIVELVDKNKVTSEEFVVRYVELSDNNLGFREKREFCKKVGFKIQGFPSYDNPKNIFGLTQHDGNWYFGILKENSNSWKKHNTRPYSYSSSLSINIAKVLPNIASRGDVNKKIIDPCCGVGTVLLEGFYAGYNISGCEINWKVVQSARKNLAYFEYPVDVIYGDIKDLEENYDVAIVDLPYGISTQASEKDQIEIIKNANRISKETIVVSCTDIRYKLLDLKLEIIDTCKIIKNENREFSRYIWICK